MKLAVKTPKVNRHWMMLVGAVALGVVALGLSHKLIKDRMAALDAAERGSHKMVTVVVALVIVFRP